MGKGEKMTKKVLGGSSSSLRTTALIPIAAKDKILVVDYNVVVEM